MQKHQRFYFHSVRFRFETLEKILDSGYILSRENSNFFLNNVTFNGNKWISVCKYYDPYYSSYDYDLRSAYQTLVIDGISLVLDDSLPAIKTRFMSYDNLYSGVIKDDDDVRYSDCIDEYQVKDSISKDHFVAVAYPYLHRLSKDAKKTQKEFDYIHYLLSKYHHDLPIIDSSHCIIEEELSKLEKRLIK